MKTPFLIWLTLCLVALSLLGTILSLVHTLWLMTWAVHMPEHATLDFGGQLLSAVYLILLIHALVRRPPWARGICISYALLLLFVAGSMALNLQHHWSYLSHRGVPANVKLIYFAVAMAFAFYAYMMTFGSRPVRDYFSPPAIETDTPDDEPSTATPGVPAPEGAVRNAPAAPSRAGPPAETPAAPVPGGGVQHGIDLRDLDLPPSPRASTHSQK